MSVADASSFVCGETLCKLVSDVVLNASKPWPNKCPARRYRGDLAWKSLEEIRAAVTKHPERPATERGTVPQPNGPHD